MKAKVSWQDAVSFKAETESGHELIIDGPPDHGGLNKGPRPMEMILLGLGSCASFDVIHILKKSRQEVTGCDVEIEATRVDDVPAVFENIHLLFKVTGGEKMSEKQVARAVELSAEKYCSVSKMLSQGGVNISFSYELN
jgi:putative redox protein